MTDLRTPLGFHWPGALGLLALVFASYATVLATAGWIWDDPEYVTRNPVLNGTIPNGLWAIWTDTSATPQYYPLVHTSFWLEWQLFGTVDVTEGGMTFQRPNATGFHFDNVALMAGIAVLFWQVLRRLQVPGAWLAAALFAVHPVNVESVAWVTERKNLLSALFALATVHFYLRFAGLGGPERRRGTYALALLCFLCGLLSKTVIAFVPPAIFLLLWWRRPGDCRRHLAWLLPMLLLGVLAGLNTARLEVEQVAGGTKYFDLTVLDRLLLAGRIVWTYFLHLVAPVEQVFFYPKWQPDPASALQWVLLAGVFAFIGVAVWSVRRLGRGPLVAVLIFGGALFPVLGFLDVYPFRFSWVADHFQFHAILSLFALLGAALSRVPLPAKARRLGAAVLLLGLAALTGGQGLVYRDQETLWRDTLAKNPDAWGAYQNLAEVLRPSGRTDQARVLYQEGHRRHPDANFLASLALLEFEAYEATTGSDATKARHLEQCIRYSEQALALRPRFPGARAQLAQAYGEQGPGRFPQVIEHLEQVITNVLGERLLGGLVLKKLRDPVIADAMRQLFSTYNAMGRARWAAGDHRGAFDWFRKSNQAVQGPGSTKWRDLYTWTAGTPWFQLEVQRIWLLAASSDPALRNPQRAETQLTQLLTGLDTRLASTGLSPGQRVICSAEGLDLQAAVQAALGDQGAAVRTADRLLKLVRERHAPAVWVREIEARRAVYAAGRTYQLATELPFAPGR